MQEVALARINGDLCSPLPMRWPNPRIVLSDKRDLTVKEIAVQRGYTEFGGFDQVSQSTDKK